VPSQSEFARISSDTNFLGQQGEVRKVVTAAIDVTAYKQSEAALAASAELFRPYCELGLVGMAIISPEKGCIEVNDEICEILGYEPTELLARTWAELTYPDDLAADVANFERVTAGECDGYSLNKRWIRKDGQVIDSTISVKCVRRDDGAVDYFVALLQDITARKQAEEAQKQTHRILESSADGFFNLDRDWRFTYVNAAGEAVVGKNRDELLGHNFWEVSPETIGTVLEQEYRRAVAENLSVAFESYYAPLDRWFSVSTYPSGFGGLAINVRDVTERKLAEIEIARKNEELQQLLAKIREMAETEKLALENKLTTELAAVTRLHEFSARLLASTELQPLLEELLNAIISLQNADFGNIQLYNPDSLALEIVVQRGFQQDFLDHFKSVHDDGAACGRAMQRRERIIIQDVQTDPDFEPHRRIAASAGFRAVQSTPLLTRTGELLGMISTHFRQPHVPSEHELRLTDLYAVHATELIVRKQSEAAVLRYQQELQGLTSKLIEAQEHENKHLARELHDVFSQKLAVLGMEIAALGQDPPESSGKLKRRLQQLTEKIGFLSRDIHQISRQLHPAILDDLGLEAALRNECLVFSQHHGIPAEFVSRDVPRSLSGDLSLCLYRVAQESLRNIGNHALAQEVRVDLSANDREIGLVIEDSGHGFDLQDGRGKGGLGLVSMEERIRLVNGTLSIRSQPGKGTRLEIRAPLRDIEL
jgi:PAS domain S-box-containing protein